MLIEYAIAALAIAGAAAAAVCLAHVLDRKQKSPP